MRGGLFIPAAQVTLDTVMSAKKLFLKPIVAASLLTVTFSLPLQAQETEDGGFPPDLPGMLEALKQADDPQAAKLADEIALRWEQSGSAAMDLLLKRAKDAAQRGDLDVAVDHLTALTDHAPDFAEGWHLRASVYFQKEQPGLALHDLEMTLHLNPNHFRALFGLGVILEQLDKPELAHEAYTLALRIYPHYEEAKAALARLTPDAKGREL
ncbi:Tetratricopeptide repeat-containing protein [Thalassovita litoralis]|jgi:tetratricopeptide (TPR) repeat protein|uniref:Tetratricopeptide repeat-containing protein n=2 Tax=Thalassovita litoralis TaxID=1010611 RepID=A0A521B484_9RHOB|nr:Tetratricopeptide repeat-containing protein [Thalassovita litoralis]